MADSRPQVGVLATHTDVVERMQESSLEEMLFEASTKVLAKAGLTIEDIDAVVLSGNDETDGRVISIMASAGPSGGVDRDTTLLASSGDHALVYGWLRVLAGQSRKVLVMGWAKPSEGKDPSHAELVEAEPYLLRNIGMNHTLAAALQASAQIDAPDSTARVVAWPLTEDDLPRRGDVVHAVILGADVDAEEISPVAWIVDCGWATAAYELGSRELGGFDSLNAALGQLSARGRVGSPSQWGALEVGADSEVAVQVVTKLLGADPSTPVNASGALSDTLTSPHVVGLGRMVAAIDGLGRPDAPGTAAGVGFHGYAGQGATVALFAKKKGAVA